MHFGRAQRWFTGKEAIVILSSHLPPRQRLTRLCGTLTDVVMNPRLSRRAVREIEHELARSDPYLKVLLLSFTGQRIRRRPLRLFARAGAAAATPPGG